MADEARSTALKGSQAVAKTTDGMNSIRSQVQETAKRIKRLGESSQEIGEIVQLIGDIADRTSILALLSSWTRRVPPLGPARRVPPHRHSGVCAPNLECG